MYFLRTIGLLLLPLIIITNAQQLVSDFSKEKYKYVFGSQPIPVRDALRFLEEIYQINFMYEDALIENKYCPPFSELSRQFHKDLQHVIGNFPIQYIRVSPKTFVLFPKKAVLSNRRVIRGKIMNTDGNPIPDAEVIIEGTIWGAAANVKGFFEIKNIPEGKYTLVAKCMGYRPAYKELVVKENDEVYLNFILEQDVLNMEEIVTIASRNPLTKIESSVAITTANSTQISERAPRSTADLLRFIPGFYVESSGGISGNNLFPRGIPQDGSYRYVAMYEDGLPVFEAPELSFANIDIFFRVDETISQMEGVRGGTGSIYASNAPGGIINFISKTGTNELQMMTKISVGDHGYYRFDYNIGGPFLKKFRFNVGGFVRYDNGIRYPGFPANRGGQIKGNLSWLFPRGYVRLYAKYLNDRNVFYLPIPLQNPENPKALPGLNANYGTMTTVHTQKAFFPTPEGKILERDLSDGIHPDLKSVTTEIALEMGRGWTIQNITRLMNANLQFNAIFSLDNPVPANLFAISLKRLDTLPNFDHFEYRYVDDDRPIKDIEHLNQNGLVARNGWWSVNKPLYSFTNHLLLKKRWRGHTWSTGFYFTRYGADDFWYWQNILTEVKTIPRLLNLYAFDARNNLIAAVTQNGFEQYGTFYVNAKSQATVAAVSIVDEWQANNSLRVDAGIRLEYNRYRGKVENTRNNFIVGKGESWAEQHVTYGDGTFRKFDHTFKESAFSFGANYSFHPHLAAYMRVSRGYRTPDFDHWLFSSSRGNSQYVYQVEGGLKFSSEKLAFFSTLFFSKLNYIPFIDELVVNGRIIKKSRFANSTTIGSEWEAIWVPSKFFQINLIGTLQDPRLRDFRPSTINPQTGQRMTINLSGKRVRRIPGILTNTRLLFTRWDFKIYGEWQFVGERFVDDANTATLPAYHLFNAGIYYSFPQKGLKLGLNLTNLTNSIGLTEGNPRVEQVFANRDDKIFMARPVLGRSIVISAKYNF